MRRSLIALALLSTTILASTAAPSFSGPLPASPPEAGQSRIDAGAPRNDVTRPPARAGEGRRDLEDRDAKRPPEDGRPRPPVPGHSDARGPERQEPGHPPHGPRDLAFELSAKLAAAETYVGITSAQLDAWRTYTGALIEFLDHDGHSHVSDGPLRGPRPDAPPRNEGRRPPAGEELPLFGERLADVAIEHANQANALKAAIDALRKTLSAEQLGRLARAEHAFLQPRPPHPPGDRSAPHDRRQADIPPSPAGD